MHTSTNTKMKHQEQTTLFTRIAWQTQCETVVIAWGKMIKVLVQVHSHLEVASFLQLHPIHTCTSSFSISPRSQQKELKEILLHRVLASRDT